MTLIPTNITKLLIPIGAAALAVALVMLAARAAELGWWSNGDIGAGEGVISVDMPIYESIGDLSAASEVAALGTVLEAAGEATDFGLEDDGTLGSPDAAEGIPYVFYRIAVRETLKGAVASEIMVAKEKESFFGSDHSSDLRVNETVVLFLEERTASSSSSLQMPRADAFNNRFYVTVSLDNGVFDAANGAAAVTDDTALTPRMERLFAQTSFTLGQVKQSVGVSDGDGQAGGPGGPTGPGNGGGTQTTN